VFVFPPGRILACLDLLGGLLDDVVRALLGGHQVVDLVDLVQHLLAVIALGEVEQGLGDGRLQRIGQVAANRPAIVRDLRGVGEDDHLGREVAVGRRDAAGIVEADTDLCVAVAHGDRGRVMAAREDRVDVGLVIETGLDQLQRREDVARAGRLLDERHLGALDLGKGVLAQRPFDDLGRVVIGAVAVEERQRLVVTAAALVLDRRVGAVLVRVVGHPLGVIRGAAVADRLQDDLGACAITGLQERRWPERADVGLAGAHGLHETGVVVADHALDLDAEVCGEHISDRLDLLDQRIGLTRRNESDGDAVRPVGLLVDRCRCGGRARGARACRRAGAGGAAACGDQHRDCHQRGKETEVLHLPPPCPRRLRGSVRSTVTRPPWNSPALAKTSGSGRDRAAS
jgi:hypothetical protein